MRAMTTRAAFLLLAAAVAAGGEARAADPAVVGNLVDYSGPTASVGRPYGQGKVDAAAWINAHGGAGGTAVALDTVDYAYQVPRAIAQYEKWRERGAVAIEGWGTADTEALARFATADRIPYLSGSYSAQFTDPVGGGADARRGTPYNFIMGPSYSDGARALLEWAIADWRGRGETRAPVFVHMGDNHPYPNAPKAAGESYARELGFSVAPAIQYSMTPTDVRQQCRDLNRLGVDYAYLGNTTDSNVALLRTCREEGVRTQFLVNIWGFDEQAIRAAGRAADGVVWVMGAAPWTSNAPGMELVRKISAAADPSATFRTHHYVRGVCALYYLKEAMDWAAAHGGVSGPNIRDGMYGRAEWTPEGLEGVCPKATWTSLDHRGFNAVPLYRASVPGDFPAGADVPSLIASGAISVTPVAEIEVPRKREWLGW